MATAVYGYGYARKLSVGGSSLDVRASQIEIRRVIGGVDGASSASAVSVDRTSTFLLARPTLVDVLPSPTALNRPRTAGGTTARSSMYPPTTPAAPDFAAMTKAHSAAHAKTLSGDSGRRFSLFPRPQTATGGERMLAPSPPLPPLAEKAALTTEATAAKKAKGEKSKGFVQFSAFFKATFRFGKLRKGEMNRSASVAPEL